jgi:hypothetical protein
MQKTLKNKKKHNKNINTNKTKYNKYNKYNKKGGGNNNISLKQTLHPLNRLNVRVNTVKNYTRRVQNLWENLYKGNCKYFVLKNLDSLWKVADNVFTEYKTIIDKNMNKNDIEKFQPHFIERYVRYLQLHRQSKYYIQALSDSTNDATIENLNLLSFFYCIIFSLLENYFILFESDIDLFKLNDIIMNNNFKINYDNLTKLIFNDNTYKQIFKKEYLHCDSEIRIIFVVLGNLSLENLVISILNKVLLIGFNIKSEYADSTLMSPYIFVNHDLSHTEDIIPNLVFLDSIIDNNKFTIKDIILKIINIYKSDNIKYDKILLILFLILHELPKYIKKIFISLSNQHEDLPSLNDIFYYSNYNKNNKELKLDDRWTTENDYKGLIPSDITEENEILDYLKDSYSLFFNKLIEIFESGIIEDTDHQNISNNKKNKIKNKISSFKPPKLPDY